METMIREVDEDVKPETSAPDSTATTEPTVESGSQGRIAIPVRLLRALELWGLHLHYDAKLRLGGLSDEWLVYGEDGPEGPIPCREVLHRLLHGQSPLFVVHTAKGQTTPDAEIPWIKLQYTSVWNVPAVGLAVTVCFWSVLVLLGFAIVLNLVPWRFNSLATIGYWGAVAAWLWRRYGPRRLSNGGERTTDGR